MKLDKTKCLAIIPARAGSKRIPLKNIKNFFGKPIISYSINSAKDSGLFSDIIVSTDSKEIAEVANKFGAKTPFLRPKNISDDFTPVIDVTKHALKELDQSYRYVCVIYATAPFIQLKYLTKGLMTLKNSKNAINSFSATASPHPIQRMFQINEEGYSFMRNPDNYYKRSQDLENFYYDAGQFYWTDLQRERESKSEVLFNQQSIPIILPQYLVNDIDSEEDWKRAELLYESFLNNQTLSND